VVIRRHCVFVVAKKGDKVNSQCLLCARIFWNKRIEKCPRCRGLCHVWSDRHTYFLERKKSGAIEICALYYASAMAQTRDA